MSFEYKQKIPSPINIISELPLNKNLSEIKSKRDNELKDVFTGKSDKLALIIGPCSADNEDAVCEYVSRLSKVQDKVKDKLLLVPRIYTNKPRTTGEGYKGMMHQPDPLDEPNIVEGIKAIRRMHIKTIKETELSAADEMLYPDNYPYLEDLLSYVAVGARSVENQQHRLAISGIDIPAGMKNPTSGDMGVMLNSVFAAQMPHVFIYNGSEVKTTGNPLTHCVLRGAVNHYGQSIANYHYEDLMKLFEMYSKKTLKNQAVIIDTNHSNSNKHYWEQPRIVFEVLQNIKISKDLRCLIKGFMIESYIEEGSQDVTGKVFGKSITDPCLGWDQTEKLILDVAEMIV
jgi:3-deoxy-7-phosphoheptulonate synthase